MVDQEFENQLRTYKENLHPISIKLFYPKGETQIDYLARNLYEITEGYHDLKMLIEIYDYIKTIMKFGNPIFYYDAYIRTKRKYGNVIETERIVNLISFIRFEPKDIAQGKMMDEERRIIKNDINKVTREIEIIEKNTNGDYMTGAYGKFGYDLTNPIPVYGFSGTDHYLSHLRALDGQSFACERIGSFISENIKMLTDGYRITFPNQEEQIMYINLYNTSTSKKAPLGFYLAETNVNLKG